MIESKFNVKTSIWCNVYYYYCFYLCEKRRQYVTQWHNESLWHTFIDISLNWSTRCDYVGAHAMIFFFHRIHRPHTHSQTSVQRCKCVLLRWLEGNAMFSFEVFIEQFLNENIQNFVQFQYIAEKNYVLISKKSRINTVSVKNVMKMSFIWAAAPKEEWKIWT